MMIKVILYILTLLASVLYLYQKNDKKINDEDKPSDNTDKLIPSEPTEVIDKEDFEHDEVIDTAITNPD